MKITIGYFYPELLNLYGDHGNVEILVARAQARGIETEVIEISTHTQLDQVTMDRVNLLFMGGGPDAAQEEMYTDLTTQKAPFLKKYVEDGGMSLLICGSYQLFGHYYQDANGDKLEGLGVLDLYTQHFGKDKPRCIGNVVARMTDQLRLEMEPFNATLHTLVGFENHGGRTYLGDSVQPFAHIQKGHGNNGESGEEGARYKNTFGTYLHGPILSKNPHLADYCIAKAVGATELERLDDTLIYAAHEHAKQLQ